MTTTTFKRASGNHSSTMIATLSDGHSKRFFNEVDANSWIIQQQKETGATGIRLEYNNESRTYYDGGSYYDSKSDQRLLTKVTGVKCSSEYYNSLQD